jgi:hypothetical protein
MARRLAGNSRANKPSAILINNLERLKNEEASVKIPLAFFAAKVLAIK